MSMTREEAIEYFKMKVSAREAIGNDIGTDYEAYKIALTALHPVSREQVEKVWRGKWIGMTDDDGCTWYECSRCEHDLDSLEEPNHFCPACGAPMTDEAVGMVMKKLEALHNG